ncbi:MAG: aminoglycoside phosphotransferase family protein [Oscillospiraceae bacterium]|nr:aminoglycoside phosphotransferase family protein [Oscillospiraceae bacterium]
MVHEKELKGGNISSVSTNGSIVFKDAKSQSVTIQRLLKHLQQKGVNFCPKPLGFDDYGREMLSYVKGSTTLDYPQVSLITERIDIVKRAALMLRELHDATLDFIRSDDDIWFLRYDGDLPKEVICHNDFAPYNVTFEDDLPIGLIDFDTACPAPRVWDIAYAAYRFIPLSKSVYDCNLGKYRDYDEDKDCEERRILLNEFLQNYGFNGDIGKYLVQRLESLVRLFDEECTKGNKVFIKMREEGHQDFYLNEIEFIKKNFYRWKGELYGTK